MEIIFSKFSVFKFVHLYGMHCGNEIHVYNVYNQIRVIILSIFSTISHFYVLGILYSSSHKREKVNVICECLKVYSYVNVSTIYFSFHIWFSNP
jgi:hypothetical protein